MKTLISCLLMLWLSVPLLGQSLCAPFDVPSRLPTHALGGVWGPNGLVLPNAEAKELLVFSPDGRAVGEERGPASVLLSSLPVVDVRAKNFGYAYLLSDASFRLESQEGVNRALRPGGIVLEQLFGLTNSMLVEIGGLEIPEGEAVLEQFYNWDVSEFGDSLYIYGEASLGGNRYLKGFMKVNVASYEKGFEFILSPELFVWNPTNPPEETGEVAYRLGYPHIASIESKTYILKQTANSPELWLYDTTKGNRRLAANRLLRLEEILPNEGPFTPLRERNLNTDFRSVMQQIWGGTHAVALYAWKESLYILWNDVQSQWKLTQITPSETGTEVEVVGTIPLRTSQPDRDLILVPGSPHFALIERDPVQRLNRAVTGIKYISADQLSDISGIPLCGDE